MGRIRAGSKVRWFRYSAAEPRHRPFVSHRRTTRFSLATPVKADGTFSFGRIPPDSYTVLLQDANDLALTPKSDGAVRYQERTVV